MATEQTRLELRGWKEIAGRLQVSVRTVQRWERELGLPVHRLQHQHGAVVVAFSDELERWRQAAGVWRGVPPRDVEAAPGPESSADTERRGDAAFASAPYSWRRPTAKTPAALGGLGLVVAAALVWVGQGRADRAAAPAQVALSGAVWVTVQVAGVPALRVQFPPTGSGSLRLDGAHVVFTAKPLDGSALTLTVADDSQRCQLGKTGVELRRDSPYRHSGQGCSLEAVWSDRVPQSGAGGSMNPLAVAPERR